MHKKLKTNVISEKNIELSFFANIYIYSAQRKW